MQTRRAAECDWLAVEALDELGAGFGDGEETVHDGTFEFGLTSCVFRRFDLSRQYVAWQYAICGQYVACRQDVACRQ